MVHKDIADKAGYAHLRSDDRQYPFDALGHFTVDIHMGTVLRGYIDQKPFPVSAGFILFPFGLLHGGLFRWSICRYG